MNLSANKGNKAQQVECPEYGLERAASGKINNKGNNPLSGLSATELRDQTNSFCETYGFQDKVNTFHKAALVAQRPDAFDSIEDLIKDDKHWLRREITNRWHLPWAMYMCIVIVSIGSAVQGWDNTGANGANLSFQEEFGIADRPWLIGVIKSAPSLFGLLSAWAADPVKNSSNVEELFSSPDSSWSSQFLLKGSRKTGLFMGLGMGIKISTIPIYSAEVSPANLRGGIVTSFQLWVAFGILLGFSTNLIFMDVGRLAWRFQLSAAFVPAMPLLVLIWLCPESPRWLMKKGRYQIRRATVSSSVIVIAQEFSGINIMAFYSSTIFSEAGYSVKQSLLASFGFGLVSFFFAFPAIYTMDTFGRRNLLLSTFPQMAWCLLGCGFTFLMSSDNPAKIPLIALFVFLFGAFYGPGIGPIPSIYFSESFPLSHREIGAAFTICVNNSFSSALGLTFPSPLANLTPTGAFCFYAGLNMLSFVVIFFVVPETKQRTLEELDEVFSISTTRHAAYQTRVCLPWLIKRFILRQKDVVLPELL
ncbi:hypothetical protein D6D05_04235 [Aureobasidium pullulans]|nr:hypothetical protein D6D05_04235 [Aureobasidium pullulans]